MGLVKALELALGIWLLGVVFGLELIAGLLWWRFGTRYALLFATIQLASWTLRIPGYFIIGLLAYTGSWHLGPDKLYHWPALWWIYDNEEDGVLPTWYHKANPTWSDSRIAFNWCARRNSTNNLRYVPGVSKVGRPFYRRTFTLLRRPMYFQAGWNPSGYPVISAGSVN